MTAPLVMKFGGTSVGGGEQLARAAAIAVEAARTRPVAVVVSAMSGTTDTLLGYADATAGAFADSSLLTTTDAIAPDGDGSFAELRETLAERHLRAAREVVPGEHLPEVESEILGLLDNLGRVLETKAVSPSARRAEVAVHGEWMSARIMAGAVRGLGVDAEVARDPIATSADYREGEVKVEETQRRAGEYVRPILERGAVAVVSGYVGHTPSGRPTTLGRGGSDLSATVLGRALGSGEVWILSDVDGVLDADPRLVPNATLMERLSYREASIFASLGAKVLHPRTMEPAAETGMEVRVRNTFNPDCEGTLVSGFEDGDGVRCVALRRSFTVEIPCAPSHRREAATVVCIGAPHKRDLNRGLRALKRGKIPTVHAGKAPAGLVFVVYAEAADEALRVLHAEFLVPAKGRRPLAEGVA
jgi:aspartate kinase